ncbi:autotransporter assembly complex protein TamA [Shimia biformata]|uniref:autotransporter assembly complex protein TamA n=1 Tax=Shimia biformata TaxID=1294299 RepID=UPI0019506608|nr:BamA/TamA family outer membrane protein [Shimia biformata]
MAFSTSAQAFEITLQTDEGAEALERRIKGASLVYDARRSDITDADDIIAAAQSDYGRLIGILYEAGHYGPIIQIKVDGREAADIPPGSGIRSVNMVTLDITAGPVFQLGTVQVAPLSPGVALPPEFAKGQTAHLSSIQKAVSTARDGWRNEGHAKAAVAQDRVTANHNRRELDVDVEMDPGPRLSFGALLVTGSSRISEDRLREIVSLPTGKQFHPDEVERIQRRLRRTGTFSVATLTEAATPNPDDTLDMVLETSDAKPRRIGFGLELESDEGLTLNGFWVHRNLFGGAERLRIEGEIKGLGGTGSGNDYRLKTEFSRPATFHPDTDLSALLELRRLDERLYLVDQATASVGLRRYFSKTLQGAIDLGFVHSRADDDFGKRTMNNVILPVSMTWNRRNDDLNPTSGTYLRGTVAPFLGFGASANGARITADGRGYFPLGTESRVVLAGRVQLGSIVGTSIQETPPNWLFLSGGGGTVRGTGYQSNSVFTGPAESGGRSFVGFQGEARIRITNTISTVLFYDIGYVGAESFYDGSGSWQSGAGIGVRYDTGIGPIRLDLAGPVSGPGADGLQVYVGIGQAF